MFNNVLDANTCARMLAPSKVAGPKDTVLAATAEGIREGGRTGKAEALSVAAAVLVLPVLVLLPPMPNLMRICKVRSIHRVSTAAIDASRHTAARLSPVAGTDALP